MTGIAQSSKHELDPLTREAALDTKLKRLQSPLRDYFRSSLAPGQ
jgi:hypothetical protein